MSQICYCKTPDIKTTERGDKHCERCGHWYLDHDNGTTLRAIRENVEAAASAKIGRNDACPCGSGKKYKKCCLT